MKIAIIGAGFTGLTAGYYLSKKGHDVEIFELDEKPGGLAIGYKENGWKWTLEAHYHHWFTNDNEVLKLAEDIGHRVIIRRPKTSSFVDGKIFQLDSPSSLLKFPKLDMLDKIRMGVSLALLRYNPLWKPLENYLAEPYLKLSMGEKGYKKIWKPLLENKLGKYSNKVSLAWFWARVYKRTEKLAYPEGGFLKFALHLESEIKNLGGKFYYNTRVENINSDKNPQIKFSTNKGESKSKIYDSAIVTLPSVMFSKITPSLSDEYIKNTKHLKGIGAMNLVLRLRNRFLQDNTYWLNMCDEKSPILAIVEHTNFMDKKNYNNEHLLYLGNYLETNDEKYKMSADDLLKLYHPWLNKINPNYKSSIIDCRLFHAPFAQPIITPNYSKRIPSFKTPLKNVYLANIEQVYPWDRGTNYAVELGKKISELIGAK